MPDRAEVISQLQIIRTWADVDRKYGGIKPECCDYIVKWIDDALALLKEQEPVKPMEGMLCGNCGCRIHQNGSYCYNCGRAVLWNG